MLSAPFPVRGSAMAEAYLEWLSPASPMFGPHPEIRDGWMTKPGGRGRSSKPTAVHPGLFSVTATVEATTPAQDGKLVDALSKVLLAFPS
jgi:hypothetical protein